jgi:hypothetical protein
MVFKKVINLASAGGVSAMRECQPAKGASRRAGAGAGVTYAFFNPILCPL